MQVSSGVHLVSVLVSVCEVAAYVANVSNSTAQMKGGNVATTTGLKPTERNSQVQAQWGWLIFLLVPPFP